MKRFVIEQSEDEFYTTHAGLAFIGPALNRFTTLASALRAFDTPVDTYSGSDVVFSFCVLLAEGKNDFVAIEQHRKDSHFKESLGMNAVPSESTLRQRMDDLALKYLATGHAPLDIDGFVMDNSGSSKENVSCTYQKVDGYLALPAYLGTEGWLVNQHLLPGSQHPQKTFIPFYSGDAGACTSILQEEDFAASGFSP